VQQPVEHRLRRLLHHLGGLQLPVVVDDWATNVDRVLSLGIG
jgi:hypothetical protein